MRKKNKAEGFTVLISNYIINYSYQKQYGIVIKKDTHTGRGNRIEIPDMNSFTYG